MAAEDFTDLHTHALLLSECRNSLRLHAHFDRVERRGKGCSGATADATS